MQEPGGKSNYSISWGHQEEPVKKNLDSGIS